MEFDPIIEAYKRFIEQSEFNLQSILLYIFFSTVALLILFFRIYMDNKKRKRELEMLKERSTEEIRIASEKTKLELQDRFQDMLIKDSENYRAFITAELNENKRINGILMKDKEVLSRRVELLEIELRSANIKIVENDKIKEENREMKRRIEVLNIETSQMKENIVRLENENAQLKVRIEQIQDEYEKRGDYIKNLETRLEILTKKTGELEDGRSSTGTN